MAKGEEFLGIRIFRFYIRCPKCLTDITYKVSIIWNTSCNFIDMSYAMLKLFIGQTIEFTIIVTGFAKRVLYTPPILQLR